MKHFTGEGNIATLLARARGGCKESLGKLLETYRNHLLLVANQSLDAAVQGKVGASDMVQETMLEAQRDFAQFQGETDAQFLAWLRELLRNNVLDVTRRYRDTDKRQIDLEMSLDVGSSSMDLRDQIFSDSPSPHGTAVRREEADAMEAAIARLPEEYAQVIRLRVHDGLAYSEIGAKMNRPENAVRALFYRALDRLRLEMGDDDATSSG